MLRAGQFARADEFGRLVWLGGGSRTAKKRADTFQEQNSRSAQQCDRCEDVDWWVGWWRCCSQEALQSGWARFRLEFDMT